MRPNRFPCSDVRSARGFTLMELVAVLAIVAILSVSAAAMFSRQSFDTARFARELEAVLAYAQKSAVAQRRTVNVSVAADKMSFTICSGFNPCGALQNLALPIQAGGNELAVPAGVAVLATVSGVAEPLPYAFTFTPLGAATIAGPLVVTATGDGSRSVRVEAGTGYVYALP